MFSFDGAPMDAESPPAPINVRVDGVSLRPTIRIVAGELDLMATHAEEAIWSSGLPVFQRGDALVRPVCHEVPASRGRMTIAAGFRDLDQAAAIDTLSQSATWIAFDGRSKKDVRRNPPADVASILLSRSGHWHKLPAVAGVVTAPTLRPDCTVLLQEGYDTATRLYHVPDPSLGNLDLPPTPTKRHGEEALALLDELLDGFPFVSNVDRAVAISALITPVVRGALTVAPLHAFRASTAGTGKSFLCDVASAICTGRPCPVVAAGHTDEETEKRLVGLLMAGFPMVSVDNVNGELGGDLLCQIVERPIVRIRPLGRSDIREIESRASVFATGNGLRVRGDMTRRTVVCTLDAGVERPELRTFDFNPVERVLTDRAAYVAACLTVVRSYAAAGMPALLSPLASFTDWSDRVRSALVWLGCPDPTESMEAARQEDPELAELREMIGLWQQHIGTNEPLTAREIIQSAESRLQTQMGEPTELAMPDLRDALLRIAGDRGTISTKRLGRWMLNHQGRIVDGLRFRPGVNAQGGVRRWLLTN